MEIEGEAEPVTLPGDGKDLVAFLSFAVMRGFGAQHALIVLADRLYAEHHVPMGPLSSFYDRRIEDTEDAERIEHAWQPAGPLRSSLDAVRTALATDSHAQTLARRGAAEDIGEQAGSLVDALADAEAIGQRVRLVYEL